MSNHVEWSKLNNAQKDTQRSVERNQNSLKWIMIITSTSLVISLVNFVLIMFR